MYPFPISLGQVLRPGTFVVLQIESLVKKLKCQLLLILLLIPSILYPQTVTISGNKFVVGSNQIFFNGVNTPWQYQSDGDISFLKKNFDVNWWNNEFQTEVNNKMNMCRVWIHGTGYYNPSINANGSVNAYASNDAFWTQMDALVNAAEQKKIYLFPTLWSFDMVKDNTAYYQRYRNLILSDANIDSYINNFLIPFVQRYSNRPYVFGYDICNEPEHMWRDANCGNLSSYWVTRFLAKCAAAINQNTSKPVTVGAMWIIYNSPNFGGKDDTSNAGWNRYTNAHLQQFHANSNAYLDFYSPHWYGWQYDNGTSGPFERTVTNWVGTDDKPVLVGETFGGDMSYISMANYYKQSYTNGFDGVCGWRNTNSNDGYGTFGGIANGTNAFYTAYPSLVYPGGTTTPPAPNIAYNKATYASSSENTTNTPAKAVDANGTTRWSSAFADPQYFVVDLGANYNINRVKISWEGAYGKNYQIQFSTNNTTWTTAKTISNNTSLTNDHTGLSGTARYVKMYGTARGTIYGYSMWEFEVYGTAGARIGLAENSLPDELTELITAYPNPTRGETTISVNIPVDGNVDISLLSPIGSKVCVIKQGWLEAGRHQFNIITESFPAGLYHCTAHYGNKRSTKKIIVTHD
jgi:hypothetical protein